MSFIAQLLFSPRYTCRVSESCEPKFLILIVIYSFSIDLASQTEIHLGVKWIEKVILQSKFWFDSTKFRKDLCVCATLIILPPENRSSDCIQIEIDHIESKLVIKKSKLIILNRNWLYQIKIDHIKSKCIISNRNLSYSFQFEMIQKHISLSGRPLDTWREELHSLSSSLKYDPTLIDSWASQLFPPRTKRLPSSGATLWCDCPLHVLSPKCVASSDVGRCLFWSFSWPYTQVREEYELSCNNNGD